MSVLSTDQYWMAEALKLARNGLYSTHPNPRVGCIIVQGNRAIASGWHEITGGPHAEINALNRLRGDEPGDVYVTLEPCSHHGRTPPCVAALIDYCPDRVIVAMTDPNPLVGGNGIRQLREAGIEVVVGVLQEQAKQLNRGYIKRITDGKPFVRLKIATSVDGMTALKNGHSQWISGESSRRDVQFLRAQSSAILTSAATVLADDPRLDVRLSKHELGQQCEVRQPVKVIVDSRLRLTGGERIFKQDTAVWIYTTVEDVARHQPLLQAGANVQVIKATQDGRICLQTMFNHLAQQQINEIHTECGRSLGGALIQHQLVDEIILYMAPVILGSQARGAFDIGELTDMKSKLKCTIQRLRQVGDDIRLTLIPEYC